MHLLWCMWKLIVHQKNAFGSPPAWPTDPNAAQAGMSALAIQPPLVIDGRVIDEMTGVDAELLKAKLADIGTWFRGIVHNERVGWRSVLDYPSDALVREAQYAISW